MDSEFESAIPTCFVAREQAQTLLVPSWCIACKGSRSCGTDRRGPKRIQCNSSQMAIRGAVQMNMKFGAISAEGPLGLGVFLESGK